MNKLTKHLFGIFVGTLFGLGIWLLILFNYNPFKADMLTITVFFACLLIWLTGLITLIGFYIKVKANNHEVIYSLLMPTIRQSLLISLAIVGLLLLSSLRVLNWWDALMLIITMALLELFFKTKQSNKISYQNNE